MPISTRSAASAITVLIACLAMTSPSKASQAPGTGNAIGEEADAAMERLEQALARARENASPVPSPDLPPPPTETQRRRAFEGLRRRAPSPAMDERAREAMRRSEARVAAEREAMGARLRQALGLEAPHVAAIARATSVSAARTWVPVLFVSSSMPASTLRNYAAQLERAKGVLAFRGMPGGLHRVGPMAKLSAEILRTDPGCEGPACMMYDVQVIVDPLLFRQHGVERVPALAMIPGDPTLPYCEREEESPRAAHIVYGDSALSGMLEEYGRLGGTEEVRDAQARLGIR